MSTISSSHIHKLYLITFFCPTYQPWSLVQCNIFFVYHHGGYGFFVLWGCHCSRQGKRDLIRIHNNATHPIGWFSFIWVCATIIIEIKDSSHVHQFVLQQTQINCSDYNDHLALIKIDNHPRSTWMISNKECEYCIFPRGCCCCCCWEWKLTWLGRCSHLVQVSLLCVSGNSLYGIAWNLFRYTETVILSRDKTKKHPILIPYVNEKSVSGRKKKQWSPNGEITLLLLLHHKLICNLLGSLAYANGFPVGSQIGTWPNRCTDTYILLTLHETLDLYHCLFHFSKTNIVMMTCTTKVFPSDNMLFVWGCKRSSLTFFAFLRTDR